MEELFNMIANAWDGGLSGMHESSLSTDMIEGSVARACDFFHIEQPAEIESGYTTAVGLGDTGSYQDDVLFYNRAQLENMGITGQDGLDLVMTHEGTHRVLQGMETGFDSYQEELCCDYMAGVRAGLNGMDVSQLENSLIDEPQGLKHPVGTLRVEAIEQGMAFAQDYMATHTLPPTFNECLEDFKGDYMHDTAHLARLDGEAHGEYCAMEHYRRLMEREPDNELAHEQYQISEARHHYATWQSERWHSLTERDSSETLGSVGKSDGDLKEFVHKPADGQYNPVFKGNLWTKSEIESHKNHAKQEMDYQQSQMNHYSKAVADRAAAGQPHSLESHQLNVAKSKYNEAKADYNKWCNEKPKDKK